jgi:branched-chain amino acid transport system substrate-binding protein
VISIALTATFSGIAFADSARLKIGIIMPLSGEAATFAAPLKQGLELGLKTLPQDLQSQIELKFEDDGLDPKRSISAFNLQANWGAAAVVNFSSGTAHALAPLAEKTKIPLIAIASDKNIVKGREFSFIHWVSAAAEGLVAAEELKKRGHKTLAIIAGEHPGTIAIQEALADSFGWDGVVLSETFISDIRDFRGVISKVQRLNPAAVSIILFPGQCAAFAKQLKQSGYKGEISGFEVMGDPNEVKAAGGALNGIWYVDASSGTPSFLSAFKKAYGEDAGTYSAANGYDIIQLLATAWKNGKRTGPEIADYLATLKDYSGALGTYSATGDHLFTLAAVVKNTSAR